MKMDHIGYAVKRIDRAKESFEKLGFSFGEIVEDTDRNIRIAFGEKDGYRVELVSPLNRQEKSPVDAYLEKTGPTPYHLCYQSDDLAEDMERLQRQGYKVVIAPQKAVAFGGGRRVVFLACLAIGLIEIVEK